MSVQDHDRLTQQSPDYSGLLYAEQPICALASAPGAGAIAILRVSGTDTMVLMRRLLPQLSDKAAKEPRKLHRALLVDPASQKTIDDVMVALFRAPSSYTGQDMAEIFCHGGPYIVQKILSVLLATGCRLADPGEFTQRAFLNGKLDLAQAEGIKALVSAESEQQWVAAQGLVDQRLSKLVTGLRSKLIHAMAHLEALIDFPDEGDTKSAALKTVDDKIREVATSLNDLVASYQSGRIASEGLRVSIIGPPNAGKSTLLNTLLKQERAIVTPIAGTTRDYIQERCLLRGRLVTLLDTAGIRDASDVIEQQGVEKARKLASEADLVLCLMPVGFTLQQDQFLNDLLCSLSQEKLLHVRTMADLAQSVKTDELAISCHSGQGLKELEDAICARIDSFVGSLEDRTFISTPRQLNAIECAVHAIDKYWDGREQGSYEEMLAFELQETARFLLSIVGRIDNEDILDKVFSDFCVGK